MNTKVPNIDYNEAIKSSGLFRKLGFVLFAVIVYRLGTYVPVPGINSFTTVPSAGLYRNVKFVLGSVCQYIK